MKTFLLLLITLILHFSAVSSEHLEVLVRPADFGFSERDNIILMEELSKDEIVSWSTAQKRVTISIILGYIRFLPGNMLI